MFVIGAALFMICYLAFLVTHSFLFVSAAAAVVSIICAILLIQSLLSGKLSIMRTLCYTTLLTYLIPLIYYVAVADYIAPTPGQLADAAAVIVVSGTIAYCISALLPQRIDIFDLPAHSYTLIFSIVALGQAALIASGTWRYGLLSAGATTGERISPIVMLCLALSPPVMLIGAYQLGRVSRRSGVISRQTILSPMMGVFLLQCIWWAMVSRRFFGAEAVLSMIMFGAGYIGPGLTKRHLGFFAVASLAVIPAILVTWQLFYTFRVASYSFARYGELPSITELFSSSDAIDSEQLSDRYSENLYSRPFIIESISTIRDTTNDFLYGFGFVMSVINATPSVLLPGKTNIVEKYGTGETLWAHELESDPERDFANSLMLDGYVDLSIFGFAIYAMVVHFVGHGAIAVMRKFLPPSAITYLSICILSQTFQIEGQLSAWFGVLRSIIALGLVMFLVKIALGRWHHRSPPAAPYLQRPIGGPARPGLRQPLHLSPGNQRWPARRQ